MAPTYYIRSFMIKFYLSQASKVLVAVTFSLGMLFSSNAIGQTMVSPVTVDSLCIGDTIKLAASFTGSMSATFSWADTTGAMSISASSGDTVSVYPMVNTIYRIIGDTNGVKDTTYFTVKIKASPSINTTALKSTVCAGDSAKIWATGGVGLYYWATLSGTVLPFTTDTIKVLPLMTTGYVALGFGVNGCRDTSSILVQVDTVGPNVQILGDSNGCQGKTFTLIGAGASTYEWYSSANPTTPFALTDTITDASITNKRYWVFGTDSAQCVGSDTLEYIAGKNPREYFTGSIAGVDMNLAGIPNACFDEEVTLTAQLGTNSYKWGSAGTISDTVGTTTKFTVTSGVQSITFTVDSSNGCSTEYAKTFVSSTNKPAVDISWIGDSVICIGDSTRVRAETAASGLIQYSWTPSSSVVDPTLRTATLVPTTTTTYTVNLLSSGCPGNKSVTVIVQPIPDITLSQSSNGALICKDQADTITIISSTGVLFDWGYGVTSSAKVKAIAPRTTETVNITAYSSQGCSNTASITINVDTSCGINLNVPDFNVESEIKSFVHSNNLNLMFGTIPTGVVTVDVMNITGAIVKSEDLGVIESNENRLIQLESLSRGLYILRVRGENFEVVNKIYK